MTLPVEVEGVVKSFGDRTVLRNVGFAVAPAETFAIIGPSGAGKTTLLRCLNFLLRPDAGRVRYDGRGAPADPGELLALRRRIGMVTQNPLLFRGSAAYNISYGLCVREVEDPEMTDRTLAALEAVGLEDRAEARAATLSAGEAQRVAFARAIVAQPELLLLDECTANLDPVNVNILETAIREYRQATGATVLLVTHNMFQAKRLATRVALLLDGTIVETGAAAEFFDAPHDSRTRAFVRGEMPY